MRLATVTMITETRRVRVTDIECVHGPLLENPHPSTGRTPHYATHHLVPFAGGEELCRFCGESEGRIRQLTPALHQGMPCRCDVCGHSSDGVRRCAVCHLDLSVHPRAR